MKATHIKTHQNCFAAVGGGAVSVVTPGCCNTAALAARASLHRPPSAPKRFNAMPVSFLSTTQRERYGRYPDVLSGAELARYFHLDDDDREWIATKRRNSSRTRRAAAFG